MASASYRDPIRGRMVPAYQLAEAKITSAVAVLGRVLGGVGDAAIERAVVLPVSVAVQRALTDAEIERVPGLACHRATNRFGAPLRVLHHRGAPEIPSTMPCVRVRVDASGEMPEAVECGWCPTCLARAVFDR